MKKIILIATISAIVASATTVFALDVMGEKYPDVDDNAYYAEAIYNMKRLGVITGYDNGNFGPNDYVTRGQLATILDRYDNALLEPPWPSVSGIYDLHQVVCLGGLEFDINSVGIQQAHDRLCDIP